MNTETLIALAEPTRLRIVDILRDEPRSVNDLAHLLQIRQPQVSKHLRTLSKAGLVRVVPKAQKRIYHIEPAKFAELSAWLKEFDRPAWEKRLDRLEMQVTKSRKEKS